MYFQFYDNFIKIKGIQVKLYSLIIVFIFYAENKLSKL